MYNLKKYKMLKWNFQVSCKLNMLIIRYLTSFFLFFYSLIVSAQGYDRGGASAMHDAMDNAGVKRIGSGMGIGGYLILLVLFIVGLVIWSNIDKGNKR